MMGGLVHQKTQIMLLWLTLLGYSTTLPISQEANRWTCSALTTPSNKADMEVEHCLDLHIPETVLRQITSPSVEVTGKLSQASFRLEEAIFMGLANGWTYHLHAPVGQTCKQLRSDLISPVSVVSSLLHLPVIHLQCNPSVGSESVLCDRSKQVESNGVDSAEARSGISRMALDVFHYTLVPLKLSKIVTRPIAPFFYAVRVNKRMPLLMLSVSMEKGYYDGHYPCDSTSHPASVEYLPKRGLLDSHPGPDIFRSNMASTSWSLPLVLLVNAAGFFVLGFSLVTCLKCFGKQPETQRNGRSPSGPQRGDITGAGPVEFKERSAGETTMAAGNDPISLRLEEVALSGPGSSSSSRRSSASLRRSTEKNSSTTFVSPSIPVNPLFAPIPLEMFPSRVGRMKRDNFFSKEFSSIPTYDAGSINVASSPRNIAKNRSPSALPYNHSRVLLHSDDENSDGYINASYVDDFLRRRTYIAAQCPLPSTVGDFWKLVYQERCMTIIALLSNSDMENNRGCRYWPAASGKKYGKIDVRLVSSEQIDPYVIRSFLLRRKKEEFEVRQFQFTGWPDRGMPECALSLLKFRDDVWRWHEDKGTPILVHCGLGIGRSGTFIAIDANIRNMEAANKVDVANYVSYLRTCRPGMVDNEDQYLFIHEAILQELMKDNVDLVIRASNIKDLVLKMDDVDPEGTCTTHTVCTGKRKHFKQLGLVTQWITDEELHQMQGFRPCNQSKNQNPSLVPLDSHRVLLKPTGEDEDGSDYINATWIRIPFIDLTFIATQAPMESTAADFWCMVYDQNVTLVVMLNGLIEGGREYYQYWPAENGSKKCFSHGLVVCKESELELSSDITVQELSLMKMQGEIAFKQVRHVQVHRWSEHRAPVRMAPVMEAVQLVRDHNLVTHNSSPIVLQCSDGLGRCGCFSTVCFVLESLASMGQADVYKTLCALRECHPHFLHTESQFKLCFDAAYYHLEGRHREERTAV